VLKTIWYFNEDELIGIGENEWYSGSRGWWLCNAWSSIPILMFILCCVSYYKRGCNGSWYILFNIKYKEHIDIKKKKICWKHKLNLSKLRSTSLYNGRRTDMRWDRFDPQDHICLSSQMNLLIPHGCKVHRNTKTREKGLNVDGVQDQNALPLLALMSTGFRPRVHFKLTVTLCWEWCLWAESVYTYCPGAKSHGLLLALSTEE
jgi:hypothetical protein